MHGNRPTEPQLQVVITGGWCVAKKKEHTSWHAEDTISHGENKKKKKKEKKKEVPRIELANFELDSLMVSPPTLQRHELAESHSRYFSVPHLISAGGMN